MFRCCEDKSLAAEARRLADTYAAQSRIWRTHVESAASQAKERLGPLAETAAAQAKERLVPLAETAASRARPMVDDALSRVADMASDIRPQLSDWADQAGPLIAGAGKRGRLAMAALAGTIPIVAAEPEPKRSRHPILRAFGIATLVAVIALLIRALLDARDETWQPDDIFEDDDDVPTEEIIVTEEEPLQSAIPLEEDAADTGDPFRYGEGSYIGSEPPDEFVIKANDRSMKYHVPTAIGYVRCVTDIWFNSTEAAEAAGFTRALR